MGQQGGRGRFGINNRLISPVKYDRGGITRSISRGRSSGAALTNDSMKSSFEVGGSSREE